MYYRKLYNVLVLISFVYFFTSIFSLLCGYHSSLGYSMNTSTALFILYLSAGILFSSTLLIGLLGFIQLSRLQLSNNMNYSFISPFKFLYIMIMFVGFFVFFLAGMSEFFFKNDPFEAKLIFPGIPMIAHVVGLLLICFCILKERKFVLSFFCIILLTCSFHISFWIINSILYAI